MIDLQAITDNQPKNITREIQIPLFPTRDTALYCEIIFDRWVFWLVAMLNTDVYKWADNQGIKTARDGKQQDGNA